MDLSVNYRGVLTSGTRFSTLSEVKVGLGFGGKLPFTKTHTVSFSFPPFCPLPSPLTPWILSAESPCALFCFEENPVTFFQFIITLIWMQPLKYLRLVGAHFKHFKEIQRLMCQWSSPARGRMPWREHLNKTVHEMSIVETCRHCCSWKFMRTRSRLWHSVIFFPWQSSWWLLEYWPIMSKSSNEVKLCHLPRSPWKCCPVAQPDARVRSFP